MNLSYLLFQLPVLHSVGHPAQDGAPHSVPCNLTPGGQEENASPGYQNMHHEKQGASPDTGDN